MPHFELEQSISRNNFVRIAGIDEVGCGPWAGPLVTAACVLHPTKIPQHVLNLIHDSKKLTPKKREIAYEAFMELSSDSELLDYGIGMVEVSELDELGLAQAIRIAMGRAVDTLSQKPDHLLIDGNRDPKLKIPTTMVIKGDDLSYSIAAASIIAKVTRDRIMKQLHETYPAYGWDSNAGYGTKLHIQALDQLGITPHHRQSYAPIKRYIQREAA